VHCTTEQINNTRIKISWRQKCGAWVREQIFTYWKAYNETLLEFDLKEYSRWKKLKRNKEGKRGIEVEGKGTLREKWGNGREEGWGKLLMGGTEGWER